MHDVDPSAIVKGGTMGMAQSQRYDLHLHSTASDGILPPREVVALAVDRGLAGIALADHDTTAGLEEAMGTAAALGIDVVPAIELSCMHPDHRTQHLLGYCMDHTSPQLQQLITWYENERRVRAQRICAKLTEKTGLVSFAEVEAEADGAPIGRPHIARVMVRHGIINHVDDAFTPEWLNPGGAGHVWPTPFHLKQAIDAVHAAGGAAVLAHPARWRELDDAIAFCEIAIENGVDGIEVDHPLHSGDAVEALARLAAEHGLIQTAGSDDHGEGQAGGTLGARTVPKSVVDRLRARAATYVTAP